MTKEKIDNAAARVFGCFDRTRGTHEQPPGNWSFRWTHYTGRAGAWLVEITNNSAKPMNFKNEDNVTVNFYRGMQTPFRNGSGYQRNMTYTIDPDARLKSLTSFKGKIRNGVFLADVTPEFRMIASSRINPVFDFKSVHARMTFNPDGTMEAFIGGYVPIQNVYFPFGDYGFAAVVLSAPWACPPAYYARCRRTPIPTSIKSKGDRQAYPASRRPIRLRACRLPGPCVCGHHHRNSRSIGQDFDQG